MRRKYRSLKETRELKPNGFLFFLRYYNENARKAETPGAQPAETEHSPVAQLVRAPH